jgi:hypothetical protein
MNAQQADNLRILIRHMEGNVKRTLDMSRVMDLCGTPACALGECTLIPAFECKPSRDCAGSHVLLSGMHMSYAKAVDTLFGSVCRPIFESSILNAWRRSEVDPLVWATKAREVLAENGYTMDDGFAAFKAKVLEPVALEVATLK